jgi:hypothetical protein
MIMMILMLCFYFLETIPAASEQESTSNVYGILGFVKLLAGKVYTGRIKLNEI